MLFDLPRYASASKHQVSLNIVTFDALIRKQLFFIISRLQNSCNLLMFSLVKLLFYLSVLETLREHAFLAFPLLVLVKADFG